MGVFRGHAGPSGAKVRPTPTSTPPSNVVVVTPTTPTNPAMNPVSPGPTVITITPAVGGTPAVVTVTPPSTPANPSPTPVTVTTSVSGGSNTTDITWITAVRIDGATKTFQKKTITITVPNSSIKTAESGWTT